MGKGVDGMGWGLCTSGDDGCWFWMLGFLVGVAGAVFVMAARYKLLSEVLVRLGDWPR